MGPQVLVVVDDDADQLQTLCRGLRYLGIPYAAAATAAEGLQHLEGPEGAAVVLLLVDVTFSQAPGAWLVQQARALRPELAVLLVAGFVLSPEAQALKAAGSAVLRRPFSAEQLGQAIASLVGGAPHHGSG